MKNAFIIMPFDDSVAEDIYKLSVKPVCERCELDIRRANEIFSVNPILDDIVLALENASVIIADISGKNANVFYELGMAHILKRKQTVMITHDDYDDVPFDVAQFRIIKYENSIAGKSSFESIFERTLKNILLDYKVLYRDEFELMIRIFDSADKDLELVALIALAKVPKPLTWSEPLDVEGHMREYPEGRPLTASSVKTVMSTFVDLGYAEVVGDIVVLTDKGKAFVEVLEEKGFVCDFVNGYYLTEGYLCEEERE